MQDDSYEIQITTTSSKLKLDTFKVRQYATKSAVVHYWHFITDDMLSRFNCSPCICTNSSVPAPAVISQFQYDVIAIEKQQLIRNNTIKIIKEFHLTSDAFIIQNFQVQQYGDCACVRPQLPCQLNITSNHNTGDLTRYIIFQAFFII